MLALAWARNNLDASGMVLDACDQLELFGSDREAITEALKARMMHWDSGSDDWYDDLDFLHPRTRTPDGMAEIEKLFRACWDWTGYDAVSAAAGAASGRGDALAIGDATFTPPICRQGTMTCAVHGGHSLRHQPRERLMRTMNAFRTIALAAAFAGVAGTAAADSIRAEINSCARDAIKGYEESMMLCENIPRNYDAAHLQCACGDADCRFRKVISVQKWQEYLICSGKANAHRVADTRKCYENVQAAAVQKAEPRFNRIANAKAMQGKGRKRDSRNAKKCIPTWWNETFVWET